MADKLLPEQIAKRLRRDILRGKLAPGDQIKERDNAAELGVSRTPMREAIRILAREGLVQLRPSRSPIVATQTIKEVADQVAVLISLERLSARLACAHARDRDIAKIAGILDHMAAHFDDTDPLDMFEIDMSFHTAIASASRNAPLAETHGIYLARLWRARYLSAVQRRNRDRVVREHGRIVEALELRDADAAEAAVYDHIHHLPEDIREVMEQETQQPREPAGKAGDD